MFRPNYAQDAPPTSIEVDGARYPVNVDFRVWIDILDMARALYPEPRALDEALDNARVIGRMQTLAFGGVLEGVDGAQALRAMAEFARGYPTMVGGGADEPDGEELLSFDYDVNALVLAIRNQSGIDLSYRRKEPFHWWEFLLEAQTLCGEHYILRAVEARASKSDSPEARRAKRRLRLPGKPTAQELRDLAALRAAAEDTQEVRNAD